MSLPFPLVLAPVLNPKPWGGTRLRDLGRHTDTQRTIGESWDVADLAAEATSTQDPVSRVVGGPHDGTRLDALLAAHEEALLGDASRSADGRFPLLVKVLDAAETLSVQVHPPRSLDPTGYKIESWVVLDAAPGAELYLGLRPSVTLDDVRSAVGSVGIVGLLARVPARPGDVVHLPAGTVHALGAGVLVSEVQTPSDTTHRLWDWPEDRDGGRELHVDAGLRAIEAGWHHNHDVQVLGADVEGVLVETEAYTLRRTTLAADEVLPTSTRGGVVRVCTVLAGGLRWTGEDGASRVRARTETVVLPAASATPVTATVDGTQVLTAVPA